jgi:hypothetical protein
MATLSYGTLPLPSFDDSLFLGSSSRTLQYVARQYTGRSTRSKRGRGRGGRGGGGSGGTDSVSSASAPSMALLDSEDPVELSAGALMMLDSPIVVVVVSCRSRKEHGHLNSR